MICDSYSAQKVPWAPVRMRVPLLSRSAAYSVNDKDCILRLGICISMIISESPSSSLITSSRDLDTFTRTSSNNVLPIWLQKDNLSSHKGNRVVICHPISAQL